MKTLTTKEYLDLKRKADKWDTLNETIGRMYYTEEGEEVDPYAEDGYDLLDIGEAAASAFGYL
jgi:hypothetical protein